MLTIYTKPGCPQCTFTFSLCDRLGLEYEKIDIIENPEARELINAWGFFSLPVVDAGGINKWTGHQPNKLQEYQTERMMNDIFN